MTRFYRVKTRLMEKYKETDNAVKINVRKRRMRWIAEKAERAQKTAENGKEKKLYNILKQLTGKENKQTAAVKSKDGEQLKSKEARRAR